MDEVVYVVDTLELISLIVGLLVFAGIGLIWLSFCIYDKMYEVIRKNRMKKYQNKKV